MNPRLITISGPLSGAVFAIRDGEMTLGRGDGNDVVVRDKAVSRTHCAIRRNGETVRLVDLKSRNGCFVNSFQTHECELYHGDRVEIGDSQFVFLSSAEKESASSGTVEMNDSMVLSSRTIQLRPEDVASLEPQRLLGSTPSERQVRDLASILRVCQALDASRDAVTLAKGLLDLILEMVPADRGAVMVAEESGAIRAVYGRWRRPETAGMVPVSRTLARQVLASGQSTLCNDILQDPNIRQTESIVASPISAVLVVPISGREKTTGVIYLAASHLTRPFEEADLHLVAGLGRVCASAFESVREVERLHEENLRLHVKIDAGHRMVGNSPALEAVHRFIEKAASVPSTVLITGESGTGKELVAQALHANGPRSSKPFIAVNCAAVPETLMETELFGYDKGAFTGALADKKGLLEAAHGGTLFLDEIGDMSLQVQAKLLRVLQEREFIRVGGTETLKVNVRVLAATNRNLKEAIKTGKFREDLYYRLHELDVQIPPLRERREDIIPLAQHFLNRHSQREKRREMQLSADAEACLKEYDWPGNVRELESAIERAVVLTSGNIIQVSDLPEELRDGGAGIGSNGKLDDVVRGAKKQAILASFKQTGGNYTEMARLLGVHPNNLHRLIRRLDIKGLLTK